MRYFVVGLLIFLTGCFGAHKNKLDTPQTISVAHVPAPRAEVLELHPEAPTKTDLDRIVTETQTSNNSTQNSITGLGVQVSKIAEKVQGFGGDLAHIDLEMNNKLAEVVDLTNDIKVELKNEINLSNQMMASIKTDLRAEVRAELSNEIHAQATANTALKNEIQSMQTEIKSGRDSYVQTISSIKESEKILITSYETLYNTMLGFTAALMAISKLYVFTAYKLLEGSRRRADERFKLLLAKGGNPNESPE